MKGLNIFIFKSAYKHLRLNNEELHITLNYHPKEVSDAEGTFGKSMLVD